MDELLIKVSDLFTIAIIESTVSREANGDVIFGGTITLFDGNGRAQSITHCKNVRVSF